jgi:hypothetical protein
MRHGEKVPAETGVMATAQGRHTPLSVVRSVGRPMLSQYYESRTKGEKTAVTRLAKSN